MDAQGELRAGDVFAGHRIEGVAGRGGMGVVYRATALDLDRPVALKLVAPGLTSDASFRERFIRETRVAASLDHPNVIPVFSAGEEEGRLYFSMRYVDGDDLRTLIRREVRLAPRRAVAIIAQIGAALDAAHARGIVHRDVKPANVLLAGHDHAYLTDFGLTKRLHSAAAETRPGGWVGTLGYVAPEQIRGERVDARADVYALGCVLFHALTGATPYARESDEATLWAHLNDPPPAVGPRAPGAPAEFEEVIARALAKAPDDRFESGGDLGRAALAAVGQAPAPNFERVVAVGAAAPGGEDPETFASPAAGATTPVTADPAWALAFRSADPSAQAPPAAGATTPRGAGADATTTPAGADGSAGASTSDPDGATAPDAPDAAGAASPGAESAGAESAGAESADAGRPGKTKPGKTAAPWRRKPRGTAAAAPPAAPGMPGAARATGGSGPGRIAAAAAVVLLLGAAAFALTRDDEKGRSPAGPGEPAPAVSGRLTTTIPVGPRPNALVIAGGRLWVASVGETRLRLVDVKTNQPVRSSPKVGVGAAALAAGFGSVWIVKGTTQTLLQYGARSARRIGAPIAIPPGTAVAVATGERGVWVGSRSGREGFEPQTIARIDYRTASLARSALIRPDGVQDLAVGAGAVWVISRSRPTVTRIDVSTGAEKRLVVGGDPQRIAVGQGAVWVSNDDGSVSRIDLSTKNIRRIPVGRDPRGIAVGRGAVWVANSLDGTATRIDPKSGKVVGEPVEVGGNPSAVAVRAGTAWFSLLADNAVARVDFTP